MTIKIDGAVGEGGGQVLRTSLTLALCGGEAIELDNIRAGRRRPGLLRQHLAALRAAAAISNAEVVGDELGSTEIRFSPRRVEAGNYEFKIGTAGSTTLLAQTILPALLLAGASSRVRVEGGTHNGLAPSVDYIENCFLPVLSAIGVEVESSLTTHGFYPNGGGDWQLDISPWKHRKALNLIERGAFRSQRAIAKTSAIPGHVGERELRRIRRKLGWADTETQAQEVTSPGPGNIVSLRITHDHITEVFESVGARGISAEQVAGRAIAPAKKYRAGTYPVAEYLADQLLLPLVLGGGGEFLTCELSEHTRTNIEVIHQILGQQCIRTRQCSAGVVVEVEAVRLLPTMA